MSIDAALARLGAYVTEVAGAWATPGAVVAVTDRERTLGVLAHGWADVERRIPVTPRTLFQIGSISKSFAALAVMREVEAGRLDLRAPVTDYLPWLPLRTVGEPVTLHHLLSHTSGLPAGMEATPSTLGEALRLARIEPTAPGPFLYSNLGYSLIGLVLERVTGEPIADVLRKAVLEPAGMTDTEPVITNALRPHLSVGYASADASRPWHPGLPVAPATWVESDSAAGSICSSAEDMAAYARLLLAGGAGVVSSSSFELMTTPVGGLEDGLGYGYGYGLEIEERDGRNLVGHSGGMIGFSSALEIDPRAGVGAVVLCNFVDLAWVPGKLVPVALELVRATVEGRALPELPAVDRASVPDAAAYAGTYRSDAGEVAVRADGDRLSLDGGGRRARLERVEADVFYPVSVSPASFFVRFGRQDGDVVELLDGPDWYAGERYRAETKPRVPEEWHAYTGVYAASSPWVPGFRVFVRRDRLVVLAPPGVEALLEPLGSGRFRLAGGDEVLPSTVTFGDLIDGRAARATCDGTDLYRMFDP